MHTVVELPAFRADAKAAGMAETEIADLVTHLAFSPQSGDVVVGTGGARKLRWRRPGTGKSGGYRVFTYYAGPHLPVFLVTVFTKGEKANLTRAERNDLRDELAGLAEDYREAARAYYRGRLH